MPQITIVNKHPRLRPAHQPQERLALQVFKGERKKGLVDIILIDTVKLRELNRRFRRENQTTDVLSFPFGAGGQPDSSGYWGEIYINLDLLGTESKREKIALRDTLALRVVHGLLHLFGYDHHSEEDLPLMLRKEKRYLSAAGFSTAVSLIERTV